MNRPEFVAVLDEDRLCLKCGANLCGRAIVREPHYGMCMVLCPSCGRRSAVQDQPRLRQWREAWIAAFTAMWVLLLTATIVVGSVMLFALSAGTSEVARESYGRMLQDRYEQWYAAHADELKQLNDPVEPRRRWLRTIEPDALLAAEGGWWNAMDKNAFFLWIPLGLYGLIVGAILTNLMPHLTRIGLFVTALLVTAGLAIPATVYWRTESDWIENGSWWQLGDVQIGMPVLMLSLAFVAVCVAAGLRFGRPAARGALRFLLPSRLRNTLALLWTAEGLPPPR